MTGTARSNGITPKQVALLHVAKRDLGMDDETYRDILLRFGRVETSKQLSARGFELVMKYFTALGFRSDWTKRTFGDRANMASPKQVELIRELWNTYSGRIDENDMELNGWLSRWHKVSALRFVNSQKATKVIAALKAMTKRKQDQI